MLVQDPPCPGYRQSQEDVGVNGIGVAATCVEGVHVELCMTVLSKHTSVHSILASVGN